MSEEESKGLGDTVEKIIHQVGDRLKIEFIRNKKGCEGCRKRKEFLNNLVPYQTKQEEEPTPQSTTEAPADCPDCNKKKKRRCRKCGDK